MIESAWKWSLAVTVTVAAVAFAPFVTRPLPEATRTRARSWEEPNLVLWAWERPEDLRALDPHQYAVAYLDRTVTLGREVTVQPRLQPIRFAAGARITAVVRVQAVAPGAINPGLVDAAADAIVASAAKPFVSAVQIDFDATVSQRPFYRALLRRVRARIRPDMPLSITALASWCSSDDWIADLPVNEAVPMFFRMTPGRRAIRSGWTYPVREPLCLTSAGLSTDEAWPALGPGLRLYVFHPRSWDTGALAIVRSRVHP